MDKNCRIKHLQRSRALFCRFRSLHAMADQDSKNLMVKNPSMRHCLLIDKDCLKHLEWQDDLVCPQYGWHHRDGVKPLKSQPIEPACSLASFGTLQWADPCSVMDYHSSSHCNQKLALIWRQSNRMKWMQPSPSLRSTGRLLSKYMDCPYYWCLRYKMFADSFQLLNQWYDVCKQMQHSNNIRRLDLKKQIANLQVSQCNSLFALFNTSAS